ncbi:MAG: 5'-methylthioadenosine/S-adenosylhomocysteine nucleosidase [Alphaproteobacteria bacterium]|nr:5'-methylthioadenosine/S-adenosylhomocysteine nucleosidase [Alphaproteobacteria bacterium]
MPACRFIPGARPTLIAGLGALLLLTAAAPRPADSHAITDETPRIAILSAFAPELAILKSDLEDASVVSVNGVTFSTGNLEGHEVVLFLSGISVVNAAMTTQLALDHFAIRDVVFSGIAGGVDPGLNIGDVVIADRWGQYLEMLFARETDDGWATMPFFEYPYGNFDMMFPRSVTVLRPGTEHLETRFWFAVDDHLLASARTMADKVALSRCTTNGSCLEEAPRIVIGGSGVSGSAFVDNAAFRAWTFQTFDARVLDMESAAVAHVAYANDIPFIAVRSLSDLAGGHEGANQLEVFLGLAADNATTVVKALLREMGEES